VWDATVFTKNRERLIGGDIAGKFMAAVLNKGSVKAGSHHDRQVGEPLLDLAEQLQPVHAGHVDVGEERVQPSTHLDDGCSRHPPLVNLLTVVDHEQVRNLLMPGKWPQRRACAQI
jgi:hypothetical protein